MLREKEKEKNKKKKNKIGERKYTLTAEIKSPEKDGVDRKYKWVAEVKDGKKKGALDKSYKFSAEIKGKGEEDSRSYSFKASNVSDSDSDESEKKEKKDKKDKKKKKCESGKSVGCTRLVEIEEPSHHGALVLRQVQFPDFRNQCYRSYLGMKNLEILYDGICVFFVCDV